MNHQRNSGYPSTSSHYQQSLQKRDNFQSHLQAPMTTPPVIGYVHSGYQSAVQHVPSTSSQFMHSSTTWTGYNATPTFNTNFGQPQMRPVRSFREGPGGPVRCGHTGCPYSGYAKDVEIHKMDRHLIFPPGYKHRKGPPDGDIGPNTTIPGTGISLNTPEAITTWIAERKKNWPTAARTTERQKREVEAVERGELSHLPRKRKHLEEYDAAADFHRGVGRGRGRGRDRGRGLHTGRGRGRAYATNDSRIPQRSSQQLVTGSNKVIRDLSLPAKPALTVTEGQDAEHEESGSDIDPSKDIISSKPLIEEKILDRSGENETEVGDVNELSKIPTKSHRKPAPKQPSRRSYNPLVDRPSFLRKLLQPEIRHTVSNLSQTIRFIVDNDFFEGVELKPGDAKPIIEELNTS